MKLSCLFPWMAGLGLTLTHAVAAAQVTVPVTKSATEETPATARVFITANRSETRVTDTLADVTIIDRASIEASAAPTLAQLLATVPGIEIAETGGAGRITSVLVRGAKTSQTLILVDGVRMENASAGGGNIEFLPLGAIERIEVVRGPASSLYGSAAIGGVIHIFTKAGTQAGAGWTARLGGEAGSLNTRKWLASVDGRFGAFGPFAGGGLSVRWSQESTDGFNVTTTQSPYFQPDRDGSRQASAHVGGTLNINGSWRAGAHWTRTHGRAAFDDGFTPDAQAQLSFRTETRALWAEGQVNAAWRTRLQWGQNDIAYDYPAYAYAPKAISQVWSWDNTLALSPWGLRGRVTAGLENVRQQVDGVGVSYAVNQRENLASFIGYDATDASATHAWRVQVRRDDPKGAAGVGGAQITGLASYAYRWGPGLSTRVGWASGWRQPTFDDLYSPFGGNALLRPEFSRGWEAAVRGDWSSPVQAQWQVLVFDRQLRDAIELDNNYVPVNLPRARVRGVTLETSVDWNAWRLGGHWTAQDATGDVIDANGVVSTQPLARRAKHFGALWGQWAQGPWTHRLTWRSQGARPDSAALTLPGYWVADWATLWAFAPSWQASFKVSNMSDAQYESVAGYRGAPRMVMLGLRWQGNW